MSKLVSVHFDDSVVIPRSRNTGGGGPLVDTRDSSFHMDDGWDIRESLPGTFVITRDEMPESVTIGGYGYSYVRAPAEVVAIEPATSAGRKRR